MAGGRRNPVEWLEYLRRATNWKVCPDPGGLGRGSRLKRNQFDDGPNTKAGIDSKVCRRTWERSEEHTSELQSRLHLVCRLLLEKKKKITITPSSYYRDNIHTDIKITQGMLVSVTPTNDQSEECL